MNDAVLTPHVNKFTCGTGKWSHRLADALQVPCYALESKIQPQYPIVSARLSEIAISNPTWIEVPRLDLIVHDWDDRQIKWVQFAQRVFAVTPALVQRLTDAGRPDAQLLICPSSLQGTPTIDGTTVLLFGMAHKRQRDALACLKSLLDKQGDYTVLLSTAVHEGSPWDGTMLDAEVAMTELFGDHLRMLGYLADDALAFALRHVHACALFFDPAVRANNTTVWAAMEAGCPVITNLDAESPSDLIHRATVFDLPQMSHWPFAHVLKDVGQAGTAVVQTRNWQAVRETLSAA